MTRARTSGVQSAAILRKPADFDFLARLQPLHVGSVPCLDDKIFRAGDFQPRAVAVAHVDELQHLGVEEGLRILAEVMESGSWDQPQFHERRKVT